MITLERDELVFRAPEVDDRASLIVSFQRTLRVPDDGGQYPLPAGLGRFPLRHVEDYGDRLPSEIRRRGGVIVPMHQAEALWIHFAGDWPTALQVGTGKICALTGEPWSDRLRQSPEQNYVAIPDQPWLDGYAVTRGEVRQFVAMPLGGGYTVEEQNTGSAEWGGIQLQAFPLRKVIWERERERQRDRDRTWVGEVASASLACMEPAMGLAPGGRIQQEIYEDGRPLSHWDDLHPSRLFVHLLNSRDWVRITGEAPPDTPITKAAYERAGIPWFDHYREDLPAIPGGTGLRGVRSLGQMGAVDGPAPAVPTAKVIDTAGRRPRVVQQPGF